MTCYTFQCSHWWKIYLQDLNVVISTNESTRIITVHVISNLASTYQFQLKTTISRLNLIKCQLGKVKKDDSEENMHCKYLRPDNDHVKYLIV